MDELHAERRFTHFMQGGNPRGADAMSRLWAMTHPEILRYVCRAEWTRYGNPAGMIRNTKMLTWLPDVVVAFPTGGPGTADMMRQARAAGVEVIEMR